MPQARWISRAGDKETRRQGDGMKQSPCLLVSLSPILFVSLSLCLCVSVANSSARAQSTQVQNPPAIESPAARITETLAGAMRLTADILAIEDAAVRDAALRKL